MTRRIFLILSLIFPSVASSATSATAEAEQFLHKSVEEVIVVTGRIKDRSSVVDQLRPVLMKRVSFGTMAKRSVGPGWRQLSPDQQKKAIELFTTLVIRTYSSKFTPGERPEVNYKTAKSVDAARVDVATTAVYLGSRYNVTYRMEKEGDWKIVDVVIEGVSLVANYRSQLDAEFKKGGASRVLASLEQSVARPQ